MQAPSEAHDQPGGGLAPEAGAPNVRSILKNDTAGVDPPQWSQHPLPWRNTPSGGENHVTDANGRRVYDGLDGAEMFRLYAGAARPLRGSTQTGLGGAVPESGRERLPVWRPGSTGGCTAGRRKAQRAPVDPVAGTFAAHHPNSSPCERVKRADSDEDPALTSLRRLR